MSVNQPKQGHPKGLYLLFATEMWERFSYYGMRALFMLFMIKALLFDKNFASQIYGSYTGLVYLTPLLGGYIADRYWGNRRSIFWGGIVMAIGQFLMFFSALNYTDPGVATYLMYLGLCSLILGNGFFKPNISTMVGQLYEPNDRRKDSAYTIFYMGINIGAGLAPLWCGFVGDTGNPADFKWGFLSAGIGMLIGVAIFELLKNKYLSTPQGEQIGLKPQKSALTENVNLIDEKEPNSKKRLFLSIGGVISLFLLFSVNFGSLFGNSTETLFSKTDWIGSIIYAIGIMMPLFIISDNSLTKVERLRILVIFIISFFVIFFWSAFEQAGASLTFFADEQTNRNILGWEMPASYFQSFNAIFVVALAPLFALLWSLLGKRGVEPSSPVKQSIGLFLLSLGYLVIAFGVRGVDSHMKVSILWLTGLYFIHTMGELCLSPIGLSIVNKLAPVRFASLLMAVWFLSNAIANKFAGTLSGLYPENGTTKSFIGYQITTLYDFFMLFVIMSGVAAIILFGLSKWLEKLMGGVK
jgi:POT family proton-dependent oligopeptide transporter